MTRSPIEPDASGSTPGKNACEPPLRFRAQLATLSRGLWASDERWVLLALAGAVLAVILMTAAAQVALNAWNTPFYNAVSARDVPGFARELLVFFAIAGALLVLNVVQMWLNMTAQLKLRAGLMHELLDQWLVPLRAFHLAHEGVLGVNPDQRLHEDARHLTELSTTLAIGLLQASVLLGVFIVVLWRISAGFVFALAGHTIDIPGYMVWAATLYALIGSAASWRVGSSLIRYNAERYGREAELRSSLVRVSDQVDTIALYRGEASERRLLDVDLAHVFAATRELVTATTNLTWVTAGYGWLTQVVPILVASPIYFSGHISFGGLMMSVGAFNQVQSSLRWFVDNFGVIADWRATLTRVAAFHQAVLTASADAAADQITIEKGEGGRMELSGLAVASHGRCTRLRDTDVRIAAGERVLITGDSGDAQTVLFRALAGLWPWGTGRIVLPGEDTFMHVARRPYVPPGRLRDALAYPSDPAAFDAERYAAALAAVGLSDLAPRLDETARWDQELGEQDLQRLAFARLPLHAPRWIVIDQALDMLDDKVRDQVIAVLGAMKASAIIATGHVNEGVTLFGRTCELVEDPDGCALPERGPDATERTAAKRTMAATA